MSQVTVAETITVATEVIRSASKVIEMQKAEIAKLRLALMQIADPANWHDAPGCLQWVGKRSVIDYIEETLK